jgi:hypothetical protein
MPADAALKHGASQHLAEASNRPSAGLLSKLLQPLGAAACRSGHGRPQQQRRAVTTGALATRAHQAPASPRAADSAAPGASAGADLTFLDLGFPRDLEAHYQVRREIGRGGNGVVQLVEDPTTGQQYGGCGPAPWRTSPRLVRRRQISRRATVQRRSRRAAGRSSGSGMRRWLWRLLR